MNPALKVVTAPTEEPVTLTQAKDHLRQDTTADDTWITGAIVAARQWFEDRTARTLIATTYDYALERFPAGGVPIRLPRATPLTAVGSVKYTNSDNVETTWSSSLYLLDTHSKLGSIRPAYGESYPSFTPRPVNPVIIRYTAGAADATAVDQAIKQRILLMIGDMYEHRETILSDDSHRIPRDLSAYFDRLVWPYVAEWRF